jgi:hypothetical protein
MIKTFLANNGKPAKTGMVETQPVKKVDIQEDPSKNIELQGLIYSSETETFRPIANASLSAIKNEFLKPNFVLSSLKGNSINRINSSFELNSENNSFFERAENISNSTKTFSFYENLTGISQERPEIIMLTDFQPIFLSEKINNDLSRFSFNPFKPQLTEAGHFFEHQLNIRKIKSHNIKHIISFNKKKSSEFSSLLSDRKSAFSSAMNDVSNTASFVSSVMKAIELLKNQLDVRDKVHVVDPQAVFKNFLIENSQMFSEERLSYLANAYQQNFTDKFDVAYLMNSFEFSPDKIKNTFTSTKIWLQLLLEMKELLKSHSLSLFDIKSTQHLADISPVKLLKIPGVKRFNILRLKNDPPSLKKIRVADEAQLPELNKNIISSYKEIYESIHFKNEEIRISALVNAVSKELKYSVALDSKDIKETLKTYFNYDVSARGNENLLDVILGNFGENIGDVPTSNAANNSLASIFQMKENNNVILPFESRTVEGDTGALKSGSEIYIDPIFKTDGNKFNTRKIKELYELLTKAEKSFSFVASKLNLLSLTYEDESAHNDSQRTAKIDSPKILLDSFLADLVESGTPSKLLKDDVSSTVFTLARFDENIRSLLFLYIISTNQATKSSLERQIVEATQRNLKQVSTEQLTNIAKDIVSIWGRQKKLEQVTTLGLSNSKLIEKIKEKLFNIPYLKPSNASRNSSSNDQYTTYGGHSDTALAMVVFDIIVSIIYNYGAKSLIGTASKEGQQTFVVQTKLNENNINSINEIYSRVNKEIAIAQHSTLLLLNTFKKLQATVNNTINVMESQTASAILSKISRSMGNNVDLVNLIFDQHQIELISSYIADLRFNLKNAKTDDITILDEFVVGQNLQEALDEFFSSEQFSSNKAKNQKILTVGIPLGFMSNLRKKVDVSKTKNAFQTERQDDVINIKLYKVDLQNPDIIFQPKEFLFELSRFPARNDSLIKQFTEGKHKSILDISKHFPTRDRIQIFTAAGEQVQYLQSQDREVEALSSKDYSFLSEKKKKQLYSNHVMSYLFEYYLKIMTGISTADYQFNLVSLEPMLEPTFLESFFDIHLNNFILEGQSTSAKSTVIPQQAKMFNSMSRINDDKRSNTTPNVNGYSAIEALSHYENSEKKSKVNLTNISTVEIKEKQAHTIAHQISVLNETARTLNDISDPLSALKRIIAPKQFDRIFNICFDPYTFEIDVESTNSTQHGKVALQMMVNRGDIILDSTQTISHLGSVQPKQSYSYRERNKSQGELLMEKYFIAIETVNEEEN